MSDWPQSHLSNTGQSTTLFIIKRPESTETSRNKEVLSDQEEVIEMKSDRSENLKFQKQTSSRHKQKICRMQREAQQ